MTSLHSSLRLTTEAEGGCAALSAVIGDPDGSPRVGVYNEGLVTVVGVETASRLLESWRWLVPPGCCAIMTTGFGDVFVHEADKGVSFLEVQRGRLEFIDPEVDWFLGEFLGLADIMQDVLRAERCGKLIAAQGALRYHQAFILEPWPMLGGNDRLENYTIGDCRVYLDLVGRALHPPAVVG